MVAPAFTPAQLNQYAGADWITAGGGLTDDRYSTLGQITTANASSLKVAWHAHLNLFIPPSVRPNPAVAPPSAEATAIEYQGTVFVPTGLDDVVALDATTGAKAWVHKSSIEPGSENFLLKVNRGLALGDGRVYMGQLDGNAVALDQATGSVVWTTKLGRWQEGYAITSPPVYYNGQVIYGVSGGDWGARSFATALDAATGKVLWKWYVVAAPGEVGGGTWSGNDWMKGGGAIWISSSVDPATGNVYFVTGNPVPWNGRGAGDNLWSDSIVALRADTGQFVWGYQTVHHDIWDYDVTNPPVIFDAMYNGVMQHGIAVASKTGWIYILNRDTGVPLIGIPEVKVPKGDGYSLTSPTQPEPIGDTFVSQCAVKSQWKKLAPDGKPWRFGCIFTPYSPHMKITHGGSFHASRPSAEGGVDWPPPAYNPNLHLDYVCARESPGSGLGAIPHKQQHFIAGQIFAVLGVNFGGGAKVPDTGNITAMDVTTNKIAWQVKWPTPCFSGMLTTAGGLVFAAHTEGTYTAYDAATGNLLWTSEQLDGGGNAPGITYSVGGKQYVLLYAGGGGAGKASDSVYAWTLP